MAKQFYALALDKLTLKKPKGLKWKGLSPTLSEILVNISENIDTHEWISKFGTFWHFL